MGFLLNQTGNGHLHSHGGHGHSHGVPPPPSHGHSHDGPPAQGPQGSLAVRAAFIHALGDLVQSIGVLIAAYIVRFKVGCNVWPGSRNCLMLKVWMGWFKGLLGRARVVFISPCNGKRTFSFLLQGFPNSVLGPPLGARFGFVPTGLGPPLGARFGFAPARHNWFKAWWGVGYLNQLCRATAKY